MAVVLRSSDRWFVCLLPAVLLAAAFWFGFAAPKRAHLAAVAAEIERTGGPDALAERNTALRAEQANLRNKRHAPATTAENPARPPAASPALALSAARNVFRQTGLQIAAESLKSGNPTEWTLSLFGEFAQLRDAMALLSGPDYPELSVETVSWKELRTGGSTAVWQIRIVL